MKVNHWFKQLNLTPARVALHKVLHQHSAVHPVIVFPPSLDWHHKLFQRPQQLALALARQGCLVFYVQWNAYDRQAPFVPIEERCYLAQVPLMTFESLPSPYVYILTWNYKQLKPFRSPKVIYDFVDDLEAFEGNPAQLDSAHTSLLREAHLVLATSERLHRQVLSTRPDSLRCPNGVDYELFSKPRQSVSHYPPQDLVPVLASGRPLIGYHGALARWVDYDLLMALASHRADLSFVLIGPDYDHTLPAKLVKLSNIFWLRVIPYHILPDYLQFIDVGIIPFKLNSITHAASPLKLFEYMAAHKPVVITAMQESMNYPGVLVARDLVDFSKKIDEALALREDVEYIRLIDQIARENTWQARARQIINALESKSRADQIQ